MRLAKGQNAAAVCFCLDIAAQKEQSPVDIPSSLLKQVFVRFEKILAEVI